MGRIGILALLIAALIGACSPSAEDATGSPPAGANASTSAMASALPPDAPFPHVVAGLPVITVAAAVELREAGRLDGQAVAVAGYYDQFTPSCPYPGRYIGPLEEWCRFAAFTDSRASAKLCHPEGSNGMRCGPPPSGPNLAPWFMTETSGNAWSWLAGGVTGQPAAFVLIGHAGDARQWQCTAATQAACASAFVVDRVAWADGRDVPPTAPETGGHQSGTVITPGMTLAQVAEAAGLGDDLLTGAAFRKGDLATIDPRWTFAGDDIAWLVRSLGAADGSGAGATRPETVWLVDDATGRVIDSHPLRLDASYRPARLWPTATVHGVECCAGEVFPFHRVTAGDGTAVYEGLVSSGAWGAENATIYGGSYGSEVLVLPAGDYAVTAWLATYEGGVAGPPRNACATQVSLRQLDEVAFNADFPPDEACTIQPAPAPTSGS